MSGKYKKITIIDYGTSNIKSIQKAFLALKCEIKITNDPSLIENADYLVLPGVGSFGNGISNLLKLNILDSINKFIIKEKPLLGICLGMQMFFQKSEEDINTNGLGFIMGKVIKIETKNKDKFVRKIPHIGWANLKINKTENGEENYIFKSITENDFFYFAHSYHCMPNTSKHITAICDYNLFNLTASVKSKNILGLQFHPEISGKAGLKVINNFLLYY